MTNRKWAAMTEPDAEYVTVQEAARMLGMARMTFWRRLREGAMLVYRSERDRRVRLVKRADVERMREPIRATPVVKVEGDTTDGN
jgi:excisionase family DNA binding protein